MSKNSRRNKARITHANNKDEVIRRAKEQMAANKPPLTEEENLTIEKAREILEKKEEILSEINKRTAELQELNKACDAKKKTLLLNEEAQSIIDQRDQTLSAAQAEAEKLRREATDNVARQMAQAENTVKDLLEKAKSEAQSLKDTATSDAESIVSNAKMQAAADAKNIIDAAKAEEKAIIDSKEQTANIRAEAIISRADEYEKQVHSSAEQYEQKIMDAAHEKSKEIVSVASSRGNPKFCVNTICGANRAKFIQGGSRENPAAAFSTT